MGWMMPRSRIDCDQFQQLAFVESLSRIARVRAQELDRNAPLSAPAFHDRHFVPDLADQGCQSSSQSGLNFFCHGVVFQIS